MAMPAPKPVVVAFPKNGEREAFLDAAYVLIGDAWVRLDEKGGKLSVELRPKAGAGDPAKLFDAAYKAAVVRRADRARAAAVEAAALSIAAELADRVDAKRHEPDRTLPPERLKEIADILAEAEKAPKDPLGITTTWNTMRKGGA